MLADPRLLAAAERLGPGLVKAAVVAALERAAPARSPRTRSPTPPSQALPATATGMRRVVNATGVVVHTNLGRAPLSAAAVEALAVAAGATDVELDLATGRRGRRGRSALAALAAAVPDAGAVHVVNNGAAALALVTCALPPGRNGDRARGEMVEIGDGFRIPELLESVGATLREVGTTNRVRLADYAEAVDEETAFVLKVHPSNFLVSGFTSAVAVAELATLPVPVVVDIGSGLLARTRGCPTSRARRPRCAPAPTWSPPPATSCSAGPQCGLLLGSADLVEPLRRHPLARALRVDKLTLAALEATLTGPTPPVAAALATRRRSCSPAPSRSPPRSRTWSPPRRCPRSPRSAAAAPPASSCRAPRWRCRPSWPRRCARAPSRSSAASRAAGCCWT